MKLTASALLGIAELTGDLMWRRTARCGRIRPRRVIFAPDITGIIVVANRRSYGTYLRESRLPHSERLTVIATTKARMHSGIMVIIFSKLLGVFALMPTNQFDELAENEKTVFFLGLAIRGTVVYEMTAQEHAARVLLAVALNLR